MIHTDNLIERWKEGDESALDSLEDAEEVMQDTLTYALTKIDRYDPGRAQFTTWLHTITVSRARDKHRRNGWWRPANLLGLNRVMGIADVQASPAQRAERASQSEDILERVQLLKPAQREVLLLRYWGEHTIPEIAQIVGCPVGTVKSRLRLAHGRLEPLLADSAREAYIATEYV